jgi:hypothetical protein
MREKRYDLEQEREMVKQLLREGGQVANQRAEKKMAEVREKVGLKLS